MFDCQNCHTSRLLSVKGEVPENFRLLVLGSGASPNGLLTHEWTIPLQLNLGGGNKLEFEVCLNCGQMQGDFPVTEFTTEQTFAAANALQAEASRADVDGFTYNPPPAALTRRNPAVTQGPNFRLPIRKDDE
jgi:hypothetical protein